MAWARTSIHVQEYGTRHQHDFHLTSYFLESVLEQSLQPHRFSNSASRDGRGGDLPIVGLLNCGPTCKANSNALSIYGCTLLPNTKTCIHSTPSVSQYMPSICENIYVSRHVLVYRYIHFWTNGSQVFSRGGSTQ